MATYSTINNYVLCLVTSNCTDGDVRLVDGPTNNEGRIEYCNKGSWSALCTNYYLSHKSAHAVCRALGYVINSSKITMISVLQYQS